jgi:hypothetical protein
MAAVSKSREAVRMEERLTLCCGTNMIDQRGLLPSGKASRDELLERVLANMKNPPPPPKA